MPRVFRQQYTRPVPADAVRTTTRVRRRGREAEVEAVRFKGEGGKLVTAPVVQTGKQAGTHCRVASPTWYGWVGGKAVPLCANKAAAEVMLADLVRQRERRGAGLADPFEEHSSRPLAEHLADFRDALTARGNTRQHVELTVSRVRAMLDGTNALFARDLELAKVNAWLLSIRQGKPCLALPPGKEEFSPREARQILGVTKESVRAAIKRHGLLARGNGKARRLPRATVEALCVLSALGVGAESINHYVRAIRSFMGWMVNKAKRLPSNPLCGLELIAATTDRRHGRRELTWQELHRLLSATRASTRTFRGLGGEARYHLYLCACGTGFRASALASLRPDSFRLEEDGTPTVVLSPRNDKSRKGKTQPLPPDLVGALRLYLTTLPAGQPIWGNTWAKDGAEMLRGDLEAAGIPYVVEGPDGPLYADFHSLRHSYITALGRAGVDLRTAQELAGHSTPALTALLAPPPTRPGRRGREAADLHHSRGRRRTRIRPG